jgi:nondiscriminating glutamyl-tRNA synthetase
VDLARPFLTDTVQYEPEAVDKHLSAPGLSAHVAALAATLRTVDPFDERHVEAAVRGSAAERGIKAGVLIHATRVAVTGRMASPGLFEVLVLLGRKRVVERLERLLIFLANRT